MKKVFVCLLAVLVLSCSSGDDGNSSNALSFETDTVIVDEDGGSATFTVVLERNAPESFTVDFRTEEGTASENIDYTANTGTLSFSGNAGERRNITVAITNDNTFEQLEEFTVVLFNISSSEVGLGANATATAQIGDVTDRIPNLQGTGDSANDLLSNTNFDRIFIEATHVEGFRPTQQTMDNFTEFLREITFKEDIEITFRELPSPGEEDLTLQEIADLESENRTAFNDGSTLAIYIYFADAPSDGDDLDQGLVTLGAVYRNTSMVIFEETIRSLASRSSLLSNTDVETATLNHEFGHLFGLVNLGTPAINDHEDIDAPNHCNVNPCLMRAELQFNAARIPRLLAGKGPKSSCSLNGLELIERMETNVARGLPAAPDLDDECRLDLENNGGRPNINL